MRKAVFDIKDLVVVHNHLWNLKIPAIAEKQGYDISSEIKKRYHIDLQYYLLISPGETPFVLSWISYTKKVTAH